MVAIEENLNFHITNISCEILTIATQKCPKFLVFYI